MKVILGFVMAFLLLGCEVKIESKSSSSPEQSRPICCDIERALQQRHARHLNGLGGWVEDHCDGWCHWCGINTNGRYMHPCHQGQCAVFGTTNTRCICMRPVVPTVAEAEVKK